MMIKAQFTKTSNMIKYVEGDHQEKIIDIRNDTIVYVLFRAAKTIKYHRGYRDWGYHREDDPAVIYNGKNHIMKWYFMGVWINCFNQEKFNQLIKLKAFW